MRKRKKREVKKRYSDRFLRKLRKKLGIKTLREQRYIAEQKALAACKKDAVLVAALLGIGKTTLYRDLKRRKPS